MTAVLDTPADWYRRNCPDVTVGDDQARCLNTLAAVAPLHNLNVPRPLRWGIHVDAWGVSALLLQELSTFDNETLTRLVIAAHENCVRVALRPWCNEHHEPRRTRAMRLMFTHDIGYGELVPMPPVMEVTLHARSARTGRLFARHPGMERFAVEPRR